MKYGSWVITYELPLKIEGSWEACGWVHRLRISMFGYPWVGAMWGTVFGVRLAAKHRQCGPVGWCARWHPGHARRQRAASRGVGPWAVMKRAPGWLGVFLADEILPNYDRDDIISPYKDPLIHWYKSFDHCSHWYINHATYQKHHAWGMHNVTILIIFYEYMITVYILYVYERDLSMICRYMVFSGHQSLY